MFPNFIIIGSTKCASSSLHFYLNQHPQICMSNIKETGFFSLRYEKGFDFYQQYFKEAVNEKAIGETTPTYCFLPYVAERIHKHFPNIKLVLCLRNPIDRAFSSWHMKTGLAEETMSFKDSMDLSLKMLDYTREKLAGADGENYWINNQKNFREKDELRPRTYIIAGEYAKIIKLYLNYFNKEQIKIIFFDDLKYKQDKTLTGLYNFLEVDNTYNIKEKETVNFQIDRKLNNIAYGLLGRKGGRTLINLIPKFVKSPLRKTLKAKTASTLTKEERIYFWKMFSDDVSELENILSVDLGHWNPANVNNKKLEISGSDQN